MYTGCSQCVTVMLIAMQPSGGAWEDARNEQNASLVLVVPDHQTIAGNQQRWGIMRLITAVIFPGFGTVEQGPCLYIAEGRGKVTDTQPCNVIMSGRLYRPQIGANNNTPSIWATSAILDISPQLLVEADRVSMDEPPCSAQRKGKSPSPRMVLTCPPLYSS